MIADPNALLPHPRFGLDYAWTTVSPSCHRAIGSSFAWRYQSPDGSKNISADEAATLQAGGIDVVTGWESSARRPLDGFDAGVSDAREKVALDHQAGCQRPIRSVFAYDDDPNVLDLNQLLPYYEGAASVIPRQDCGGYGGYALVKFLADRGFGYHFQAYAWSNGMRDPRAQIYQFSNGHNVCGSDTDYDLAYTVDFGQWSYRPTPHPIRKDDMIHAVVNQDGRLEVFVEKNDSGQVFHAFQTAKNGPWAGAEQGKRTAGWYSLETPGK